MNKTLFLLALLGIIVVSNWQFGWFRGSGVSGVSGVSVENFYTLFKPFKVKSDMVNKYVALTTSTDYDYGTMVFGVPYRKDYLEMDKFMINLLTTLLAASPILKFDIIKYEKTKDICLSVMKQDVNMGIVSEPMLIDTITGFNTVFDTKLNFTNLRFVANIGNQYIFILIRKDSGITGLQDLHRKKVSIGEQYSDIWKVSTDIMHYMSMKYDVKFDAYNIGHPMTALYALMNGHIDAMFYTDYYPSNFLSTIFSDYDIKQNLLLLPIDDFTKSTFSLAYYYYKITSIDLNKLPHTMLPMKSGGIYYTRFNPDLATLSFKQVIISNKETNNKAVYNFTKKYFENVHKFKKSPIMNNSKADLFQLSIDRSMLFIHTGAYKYYIEKGYLVDKESSPYCDDLIGKTECNKKNIAIVKHSIIH